MRPIAEFIVHRSKVVLGLTALVTLVAIAMLFRLSFNADVASFILEGTEVGMEFNDLQEKYETSDPINAMASLPEGDTFADKENLLLLFELQEAIRAVDGVGSAVSFIPETNPITGGPITAEVIESMATVTA